MKTITRRPNGSTRVITKNSGKSMTDTQFKDDCDINVIIKRFGLHGPYPHQTKRPGVYTDASQVPDLFNATLMVQEAQESFQQLPAEAREKFKNDPREMYQWLQDPKNTEEAIKLGLMTQKQKTNDEILNDELKTLNKNLAKDSHKKTATPKPDPE